MGIYSTPLQRPPTCCYLLLPVACHWLVPKLGHTAQAVETYSNREPTGCFCSPATRSIRPDTNAPQEAWRKRWAFCVVIFRTSGLVFFRILPTPVATRSMVYGVLYGLLTISAPEANSGQNGASVSSSSLSGGMRAKASFCSWLNLPTIPRTLKWPLGNAFNQNSTSFGSPLK